MNRLNYGYLCVFIFVLILLFSSFLFSDELVYRAKNPAFGGDPYNGQWLLSNAEAQNNFKEEKDPVEEFKEQLQSQLFYRLARTIVDTIFGENGELQEGSYKIGDYDVNITDDQGDLTVDIGSPDGSRTVIEVPRI